MFIQHTPCILPNTFTKRWDMMFNRIRTKRKRAVPFNWITLFWSVSILRGVFPYEPLLVFGSCHSKWQLWLIFHPIHFQSCEPLLLFSTWHKWSGEPLRLFSTPLLIGTREYHCALVFFILECGFNFLIGRVTSVWKWNWGHLSVFIYPLPGVW